jgi:DNA gyrase/topoisomerase IV subunit A
MTLSQVTRLDAGKYQKEKEELTAQITYLESLLSDPARLVALFKKELNKEDPLLTCNKDVVDLIIGDEPIQVKELSEDLICYTLPADKPIKVGALNHLSGLKLYLLEDL